MATTTTTLTAMYRNDFFTHSKLCVARVTNCLCVCVCALHFVCMHFYRPHQIIHHPPHPPIERVNRIMSRPYLFTSSPPYTKRTLQIYTHKYAYNGKISSIEQFSRILYTHAYIHNSKINPGTT